MRILGIIPARGGSKGVPGKNIKIIGGKPLLAYTADAAKNSRLLSKTIVSSEDEKIIEVALHLGLEVPFKRPAHLAEDHSPSIDVVKHALEFYRNNGEDFDAVCLLQVTTPFRKNELIDRAIEKFIGEKTDSLISVREIPAEYNPYWAYQESEVGLQPVMEAKNRATRRQDLPRCYHRDGALYLVRSTVVLEQNSLYGSTTGFIDTSNTPYVNIDTMKDWEEAEKILKHQM
ncbi:MAG: acylneuraminate cytidylyltransferase [Cytophagaceae bacterium]|nr:acylneuraminate cytidylyltransferase [Cytophagaceae bacterium]